MDRPFHHLAESDPTAAKSTGEQSPSEIWTYPHDKRPEFFDRPGILWRDAEADLFAALFYAPYSKSVPGLRCEQQEISKAATNPNNMIVRSLVKGWLFGWTDEERDEALQSTAKEVFQRIRRYFTPNNSKRVPLEGYFRFVLRQCVKRWAYNEALRRKRIPTDSLDAEGAQNRAETADNQSPDVLADKKESAEESRGWQFLSAKDRERFRAFSQHFSKPLPDGKRPTYLDLAKERTGEKWTEMSDRDRKKVADALRSEMRHLIKKIKDIDRRLREEDRCDSPER